MKGATAASLFDGPGAVRALCRAFDWAATPLGAVESWPASLRTAAAIVTHSSFPMILVWGPDLVQVYNDAYVPFIGVKHPEALGAPTHETWPDIRHFQEPIFQRVFRGETATLMEAPYLLDRGRNGEVEEVYFDAGFAPVPQEDGSIGGSLSTLLDVTDRVHGRLAQSDRERLMQELATERQRLIAAQAVAKVGSWQTNFATMEVVWSDETYHIFGLDPNTFASTHQAFLDRIHPDDAAMVDGAFRESFHTRDVSTVEHRVLLADGTVKHVEERWTTYVDDQGTPTRAVGTCQDLTTRWVADDERRQLAVALQHLSDEAVAIIDEAGHVHYANGTHARIFGYDPLDVGSLVVDDLMPDDDARAELRAILREARGGRSWSGLVRRRRVDDGRVVEIDMTVGVIPGSGPTRFFGIMRDATVRLAREQHLRRVERVAGLGTLIAGVAHELNNPLSAILGFAQLMLDAPRPAEEREDLETIVREAQRMAKIVADLRLVARNTQAGTQFQPVQLNELVQHLLKTRAYSLSTRNIAVETDLADDLPDVLADRAQIEQVVLNLIVNAEQAMEDSAIDLPRLTVRTRATATRCILSVIDNGVGISRETVDRIFDPFFTTKAQGDGTGLGLSLAQSIITEHRGEIHVDTSPGQGAAFHVDLPVAPQAHHEPDRDALTPSNSTPGAVGTLRVLLVDDEPAVRRVVARQLERRGHAVDQVAEGGQALVRLHAAEPPYDVMVCDVRMPGVGGIELLRHLREHDAAIVRRVVFLTGDIGSAESRRLVEELKVPVLEKPAGLAQIVEQVERLGAAPRGEVLES
ncbi:MAG: PAS domain S-box protein [Gemmatimonadota bacterium]|nr:PAS domain S-box protein [Gemmatimonadota bacterium]